MEEGPPSPWSALLKDNLSADEVAGFLSNAIARKEATLLSGAGLPPSADSPRRGAAAYAPSSRRPLAPPFSAERARDRRPSLAPSASAAADESLESSRPGSPGLEPTPHTQRRGGGAPSGATQPKTQAQWQAYVLKAQQAESAAREELRQLQAKVDQSSRSHTDELGESQRAREELRGQLEVRQFALQHATEARDAAIARAELLERDLFSLRTKHEDYLNATESGNEAHLATMREAEASALASLDQLRHQTERANEIEARAVNAERTCATLRLAVTSLEQAKLAVLTSLEESHEMLNEERRRTAIERALLRGFANESEQRIPILEAMAEANAKETERVEASFTELLAEQEAAAERERAVHERTVNQLRGHISELEDAVMEQQASHEAAMAQSDARHAAEMADAAEKISISEGRVELLSKQLNVLAEAAQQMKAEKATALVQLAGVKQTLEQTEAALMTASENLAASRDSEAQLNSDNDEVRAQVKALGDQLGWLEACARDAASDARPLLASREAGPIIDADMAFSDERDRWQGGINELHSTVSQLVECFGWLAAELQDQLATSPAAGDAAAPAADLHEDLAAQIRRASEGLPSTFAPISQFERGRSTLVEAIKAQAHLTTQSVAHLISCAADAEAVATLQAKQVRAQHQSTVTAMSQESSVAIASLCAEMNEVEEQCASSSALAWRQSGDLEVHANELFEAEDTLHDEMIGREKAEDSLSKAHGMLAAARDCEASLRAEIRQLEMQLSSGREREAALENTMRANGLEGELNQEELMNALTQAEETGAERAAAAAAAMDNINSMGVGGDLLRTEISDLETELAAAYEEGAELKRAGAVTESARVAARASYEAAAAEGMRLEEALVATRTELESTKEELMSATASAEQYAQECAELVAKTTALEAMAVSEKKVTDSKEAALVQGMSDLDASLKEAGSQLSTSQAQTASLAKEMQAEEALRNKCEEELSVLRDEMNKRTEEEERIRRERASVRAAQQAVEQAALQRELRTLQSQLVGPSSLAPAIAFTGGGGYPDGSSDALWAALLAEPLLPLSTPAIDAAAAIEAAAGEAYASTPAFTPATRAGRVA